MLISGRLALGLAVIATALGALGISPAIASSPPPLAAPAGGTGAYVLTATDPGSGYAPTFTGNSIQQRANGRRS